MTGSVKPHARKALDIAIALTPWLISMYVFYWLDYSQTWTSETPHRGKLSVALLATGMLSSFIIYSRLSGRKQTGPPNP